MELKVTSEKVLAAAKKCEQAKAVLQEMFPEVFEPDPSEYHLRLVRQVVDKSKRGVILTGSSGAYLFALKFPALRTSEYPYVIVYNNHYINGFRTLGSLRETWELV